VRCHFRGRPTIAGQCREPQPGRAGVQPEVNSPNIVTEGDTTTYDYDADNHLAAQHDPTVAAFRVDTTSYQANVIHHTYYDLLGRAVLQNDVALHAGTSQLVVTLCVRCRE